jgi:hypothetical protein
MAAKGSWRLKLSAPKAIYLLRSRTKHLFMAARWVVPSATPIPAANSARRAVFLSRIGLRRLAEKRLMWLPIGWQPGNPCIRSIKKGLQC